MPSETQFRSNICNANQQTLLSKARSAALEYAHRRTQPQYDIDVRNIVIENVDEIKNENDFADIPFYRSDIFNYRNLSLIEIFPKHNYNSCGYNLLLNNYPKKAKSVGNLEEFFGKTKDDGLTPNDFLKFAEHHNLSCYVMDLNGKPIVYRRRGDVSHSSKENREEKR